MKIKIPIRSGTFPDGLWEIHRTRDFFLLWVNGICELWADTMEEALQYVEDYLV